MSLNEIVILVPCHSLEDFPTELGDEPAAGLLNAFAVAFHPALLAAAERFPGYRRADEAALATEGQLAFLPSASKDWVPHGWAEDSRRNGATVVSGVSDRDEMLKAALQAVSEEEANAFSEDVVADLLALGTVYLLTELLTRHMRNYSQLDEALMCKELVAGAQAARANDKEAAESHLKRCFEMLLDCREKFYPVECYLIDLCLILPRFADEKLSKLIESGIPLNLMAQGCEWQEIIEKDAAWKSRLADSWAKNDIDILGGEWNEPPSSLMSLDSFVHNLERGRGWFQEQLGKTPTVWGRKRFGVNPQIPQILSRFDYAGGLHFVLDDGIYPEEELAKFRWQGNDGTSIDSHSRIPLAGDSASSWLRFPVRMSESMDSDHTAGIIVARWPEMRTPWFNDLRRAARFAPVLGRFTTLTEFFGSTDTHGAIHDFKAGRYLSPFLLQSVAKREANPGSRYIRYWNAQRRFESVDWCEAMTQLLSTTTPTRSSVGPHESAALQLSPDDSAEQFETVENLLASTETEVGAQLVRSLTGDTAGNGEGVLIVNPLSAARDVFVEWPEGKAPQDGTGVKFHSVDESTNGAIVDLPACGFQWLPAIDASKAKRTSGGKTPMAEDLVLKTDTFEVELSNATGGIAQVRTYRRSPNRVSQQIALRFPHERRFISKDGDTPREVASIYSAMQLRESKIVSAGPAFGCIETIGDIYDQKKKTNVAHFTQRTSVYRGLPIIRVEIELDVLHMPEGDPWTNYYCCRFAWKQESAALSASMQEGAHLVTAPRIEAPHFFEIADDKYRTTIHTPGLTFHRKVNERMLDTLLVTEGEKARKFEFVVSLDNSYPFSATRNFFTPPLVIPTQHAPPEGGRSGWLFHVGGSNVQLQRILPLLPPKRHNASPHGFRLRLLETEGLHRTIPIHCFRTPNEALQVDLNGETLATVPIENEALQVNIAGYEMCDVEVRY
ncbi:MAG: hypothetical protein KDA69_06290 [Planctomycetaceae bacterium]|nr:hypothetical protein [Planctomycetaceae bacterium]